MSWDVTTWDVFHIFSPHDVSDLMSQFYILIKKFGNWLFGFLFVPLGAKYLANKQPLNFHEFPSAWCINFCNKVFFTELDKTIVSKLSLVDWKVRLKDLVQWTLNAAYQIIFRVSWYNWSKFCVNTRVEILGTYAVQYNADVPCHIGHGICKPKWVYFRKQYSL